MGVPVEVRHLPREGRFEAIVEGRCCRLDYMMDGSVMVIHHTEVPSELEGRGIAAELTRVALDHARANGLTVRPLCGYVRAWLRRHPEQADLVAP
jgi:predicted GNAT family acetyltransferase